MTRRDVSLAGFATLLALLVVLLGAYTRLTHAGLGCPDWPGCYGLLGVPGSEAQLAQARLRFPHAPVEPDKGWNEMLHRYAAGVLALCVAWLAIRAWRAKGRDGQPLGLPLLLVLLVAVQAAFGMWTVTLKLWPPVVSAHLLGGVLTLSLLGLLTLRLHGGLSSATALPAPLRASAGIVLALLVLQIGLGGWVSAHYAASACSDLPTCQGQWWPPADFASGFDLHPPVGLDYLGGQLDSQARTAIHLAHRLGAVLLSLALLRLGWQLWRAGSRWLAGLLLTLLAVQLSLGAANVLLGFPLSLALAHSAGGAVLMLTMTLTAYRICSPLAVSQNHEKPGTGRRYDDARH